MVCPKCNKQRQPREKVVSKNGKEWLIEYCRVCNYNFDIRRWKYSGAELDDNADTKRKARRA